MPLDERTLRQLGLRMDRWSAGWGLPDADRADLIQSALVAVGLSERAAGLGGESLDRYAYAVLRNRRATLLRRRMAEARRDATLRDAERTRDAPAGPLERSAMSEQADRVRDAVAALPEIDRQIIQLRVRGEGFPAIAEALGITHDAARQRFVRAIQSLRDQVFGEP